MIADATKLLEEGKEPGKEGPVEPRHEPLYLALENFSRSIREKAKISGSAQEGYQSTLLAIKANEAIITGSKVTFQPVFFELK
jgi:hypothetical protein